MAALHSANDFARLAQRLKDAGETGLRRKLYKAISDSAEPLARKLKDAERLDTYMPRRYAGVIADDLQVTVYKRASGPNPQISVRAESHPPRQRKVIQLDDGTLRHPLFGDREHWYQQWKGLRPGFFTDAAGEAGAEVRANMSAAMDDIRQQIMGG